VDTTIKQMVMFCELKLDQHLAMKHGDLSKLAGFTFNCHGNFLGRSQLLSNIFLEEQLNNLMPTSFWLMPPLSSICSLILPSSNQTWLAGKSRVKWMFMAGKIIER